MRVAIDFDNTIVVQEGRSYEDLTTPPEFLPGARAALFVLKDAGHELMLWSRRAAPALRHDPTQDLFVRAGGRVSKRSSLALNEARYQQMLEFVARELPGVFFVIDDGSVGGKPNVDLIIDDLAMGLGSGPGQLSWQQILSRYARR